MMLKYTLIVAPLIAACTAALWAQSPSTQPSAAVERTTESGLKILETKTLGDAMKAETGDMVWVHYTGKLESNGQKFDSSFDRIGEQTGEPDPIAFKLGAGRVIKGWDEGLVGMKVGEKRTLTIPPKLAYGERTVGPIPANSTLVFDVELVGIYRGK